jgi:hypothetical protein
MFRGINSEKLIFLIQITLQGLFQSGVETQILVLVMSAPKFF